MRDEAKHPWILGEMAIARSVLDAVYDESVRAYGRDEEACGLLVGPAADVVVDGFFAMENRANKLHALDPETYPRTGRMYFDIDPMKFDREVKTREAAGHPAKVLYHSHLDVGAYFSETDAAATTMGGVEPAYDLAYLVVSVRKGVVDEHKLFVWDVRARAFVEAKLRVT